jgi:hypothetical protein
MLARSLLRRASLLTWGFSAVLEPLAVFCGFRHNCTLHQVFTFEGPAGPTCPPKPGGTSLSQWFSIVSIPMDERNTYKHGMHKFIFVGRLFHVKTQD